MPVALPLLLLTVLGCSSDTVVEPRCDDGLLNGTETAIDCGGSCDPCDPGLTCERGDDCQSRVCEDNLCVAPRCGDGVINQPDEVCDEGAATLECNASCTLVRCGDGTVDANEECDDGDADDGNDCRSDCLLPVCGDGIVWERGTGTEECDDGNGDDSDACTSSCALAACTDGITNADESDVDCGGHCGPASCDIGQICGADLDCASNSCLGDICVQASIMTGRWHTCAFDSAGAMRCWGENGGQLGYGHSQRIGDDEPASAGGAVDLGGRGVGFAGGMAHTCALLQSGAVRCWGNNQYGRLGYGHTQTIGDDETPSAAGDVLVGAPVRELALGTYHTCALLQTGGVRCWGDNRYGQLGYGHIQTIGDDEVPLSIGEVPLGGPVVQIVSGRFHNCALLETGGVRCWGWNQYGQLGYGHTANIGDNELPSSQPVLSLGPVKYLESGAHHTCAVLLDDTVRCWGYNRYGQLGYGHTSNIGDDEVPSSAGPVDLGGDIRRLVVGAYHGCVHTTSDLVRCWGDNQYGQLGYGHTQNIGDDELPSSVGYVELGGAISELSRGLGNHTCARLQASGALRCWGWNFFGQLGYGHRSDIGDDELPSSAGDVPYE